MSNRAELLHHANDVIEMLNKRREQLKFSERELLDKAKLLYLEAVEQFRKDGDVKKLSAAESQLAQWHHVFRAPAQENPSDKTKAIEHYKLWHHFEPTGEIIVDIPNNAKHLNVSGKITRLDYESNKDVHDRGKKQTVYYYHHFHKNHPYLAVDNKGRHHILGNVRVHNPDPSTGLGLGMDDNDTEQHQSLRIGDWENPQVKNPKFPRSPKNVTKLGHLCIIEYKPEGGKKALLHGDDNEYVVGHPDGHWLYIARAETREENPSTLEEKALAYMQLKEQAGISENPNWHIRERFAKYRDRFKKFLNYNDLKTYIKYKLSTKLIRDELSAIYRKHGKKALLSAITVLMFESVGTGLLSWYLQDPSGVTELESVEKMIMPAVVFIATSLIGLPPGEENPEFKDAQFMTTKEKELTLKSWIRFLKAYIEDTGETYTDTHGNNYSVVFKSFTDRLYKHLSGNCSFIAHYDRYQFFLTYFDRSDRDSEYNPVLFFEQFDRDKGTISVEYGGSDWKDAPDYSDLNNAMVDAFMEVKDKVYAKAWEKPTEPTPTEPITQERIVQMIAQERREHTGLDDNAIMQIVVDHIKAGERNPGKLAKFTLDEDNTWQYAFQYYLDEGKSEKQADALAWKDTVAEYPRLKGYRGAFPNPKKKVKYIVTAPHAELNPAEPHPHDWAARDVAIALSRRLGAKLHLADRPRAKGDLNRPSTRGTTWRQNILKSIRKGDVLLDIHSYPASTDTDNWHKYDFVVLKSHGAADPRMIVSLVENLHAKGYRAEIAESSVKNDIVETAAKRGARAVLIEVNEGTADRLGAEKIAGILSTCIAVQ